MSNEDYVKLIADKPTWEKVREFGLCIERAKDNYSDHEQARQRGSEDDAEYFLSEHYAQWERVEKLYSLIVKDLERLEKQARRGRLAIIRNGGRRK